MLTMKREFLKADLLPSGSNNNHMRKCAEQNSKQESLNVISKNDGFLSFLLV